MVTKAVLVTVPSPNSKEAGGWISSLVNWVCSYQTGAAIIDEDSGQVCDPESSVGSRLQEALVLVPRVQSKDGGVHCERETQERLSLGWPEHSRLLKGSLRQERPRSIRGQTCSYLSRDSKGMAGNQGLAPLQSCPGVHCQASWGRPC